MKQQVTRLSPHQNGKVFAVLMAIGSLIFLVPFFLFIFATAPAQARPPMFLFLLMPVFYLVFGYISVALGCALYNFMYRYVGGVEFEARNEVPNPSVEGTHNGGARLLASATSAAPSCAPHVKR